MKESTAASPIPLIPKQFIRPDADITGLVNADGVILSAVHSSTFSDSALVSSEEVVGKHLSDLYQPVPQELEALFNKAFDGESCWATVMLPTVTSEGIVDRRFVVAFQPWHDIGGKSVALVRLRLVGEQSNSEAPNLDLQGLLLNERLDYLMSEPNSLDDLHLDALVDITMKQTGFDIALHLDEDGVILDMFDVANTSARVRHPVGSNYLEYMDRFGPSFRERWHWVVEHGNYFNGYETVPRLDGTTVQLLVRARLTEMVAENGSRIVQVYVKRV